MQRAKKLARVKNMSADIDFKGAEKEKPSPDGAASLFVSLYVVILAFFILLTSNAQFDVEKTKHVVDSVNKAFSIEIPSETDVRIPSIGNELSTTQFFEDMQKSLQSVVPLEEMDVITDGQQMVITMESTALFNRDDPNLRYDRRHFYRRLAETMTKWRQDMAMQLSMVQGVETPLSVDANAKSTLEVTRAGNFARFVENQGTEPRNINIAIEQGEPGIIRLIFEAQLFESEQAETPSVTVPAEPVTHSLGGAE